MSSSQLEPYSVNLSGPWQQIWQWPWKHRKDAGRKRCQRMQGNTWHMFGVRLCSVPVMFTQIGRCVDFPTVDWWADFFKVSCRPMISDSFPLDPRIS